MCLLVLFVMAAAFYVHSLSLSLAITIKLCQKHSFAFLYCDERTVADNSEWKIDRTRREVIFFCSAEHGKQKKIDDVTRMYDLISRNCIGAIFTIAEPEQKKDPLHWLVGNKKISFLAFIFPRSLSKHAFRIVLIWHVEPFVKPNRHNNKQNRKIKIYKNFG